MPRRSDIATAVIGSGFIGTVHVEALRRIGVRVAGLLGTSPERARRAPSGSASPRATPTSTSCSPTTCRRRPRHEPNERTTRRSSGSSPPASTSCARSRSR